MPPRKFVSLKAPLPEVALQRKVIEFAMWHKWWAHHALAAYRGGKYATHQLGQKGFPDLVLARSGVVLMVELKMDGKYPGPEQRAWAVQIGAQYRLWRPIDWSDGRIQAELT